MAEFYSIINPIAILINNHAGDDQNVQILNRRLQERGFRVCFESNVRKNELMRIFSEKYTDAFLHEFDFILFVILTPSKL